MVQNHPGQNAVLCLHWISGAIVGVPIVLLEPPSPLVIIDISDANAEVLISDSWNHMFSFLPVNLLVI